MQERSPTVWRSCAACRAKTDQGLPLLYSASLTKRNGRPGFCMEGMDQVSATLPIRWTCSFGTAFFPFGDGDVLGARQTYATSAEASGPPAAGYSYVQVPISLSFRSTPIKDFRFQNPVSILRVRTEQVGGRHETYC